MAKRPTKTERNRGLLNRVAVVNLRVVTEGGTVALVALLENGVHEALPLPTVLTAESLDRLLENFFWAANRDEKGRVVAVRHALALPETSGMTP